MKLLLLVMAIAFIPSVIATSIAVSPNSISWDKIEEKRIIILNPEQREQKFFINSPANMFLFSEESGVLPAMGKKEILVSPKKFSEGDYAFYVSSVSQGIDASVEVKTSMKKTSIISLTGSIIGAHNALSIVSVVLPVCVVAITLLFLLARRKKT